MSATEKGEWVKLERIADTGIGVGRTDKIVIRLRYQVSLELTH